MRMRTRMRMQMKMKMKGICHLYVCGVALVA